MGGVRAQAHLKYILAGMLAHVPSAKEVVIPMANARVTDGLLSDEDTLAFAEAEMASFLKELA